MGKPQRFLSALLLCFALLGAAPVTPAKGLYVSDYAACITGEHKSFISGASAALEEAAGVQVVTLTVKGFGGMPARQYAQETLNGWQASGAVAADAVLILVSTGEMELYRLPSGKASGAVEEILVPLEGRDFSTPLYENYKAAAKALFVYFDADPGEKLMSGLEPGARQGSGSGLFNAAFLFAATLFIAIRGLRVNRKYHRRFGTYRPREYRRRAKKPRAFDEDDSKGIVDIDD